MNSEREIVMRLREAKELEESTFESGGKTYKCAFGKYYCDDKQISRDEYFKAKDGGSVSPSSSDEPKKPEYPEDCDFEVRDVRYDDEGLHVTAYDKEYDEEFEQSWLPGRKTIESFLKDKAYGKTPEIIDKVKKFLGDEPKKPEKKTYDQYSEAELEEEFLTIEDAIEEISDHIGDADTEDERSDYEDALDDLVGKLQDMEEYLTEEQYERSEKLQDIVRRLKDTEYTGKKIDPYEYNGVRREDFY